MNLIDSTASESYILGAVLTDESVFIDLANRIPSEAFSNSLYAELWENMSNMAARNEPVNLTALAAANRPLIDRIGVQRLAQLQQGYLGPSQLEWHVKKLMEMHFRRQVLQGASKLVNMSQDLANTSTEDVRHALEEMALGLSQVASTTGLSGGHTEAVEWISKIEERFKDPNKAYGMQTGFVELDSLTLGWQRTDLIVVGGRTSVGKSAFATENMVRLALQGYKVAMFSLEMSKEQVRNRISSNVSGVRLSSLRTGRMDRSELAKLSDTLDIVAMVAIDDTRGVTADYICTEMMRKKRRDGLDFVVVDYLQEIIEPAKLGDNSGSSLARVARKLRKAALECDCAVMALSQLNREADGKPELRHLSGSSGIESAADVTILLHRDKEKTPRILEVNVAKQRNGPTGELKLYYDPIRQKIENYYEGSVAK